VSLLAFAANCCAAAAPLLPCNRAAVRNFLIIINKRAINSVPLYYETAQT